MSRTMIAIATVAMMSALGCAGLGDAQSRLRSAVDAKKPTLDDCYASALERNRNAEGGMTLWVHVAKKTGRIDNVEVEQFAVDDLELQQCVETALVGTEMDKKPNQNLKVEYTLQFSPST